MTHVVGYIGRYFQRNLPYSTKIVGKHHHSPFNLRFPPLFSSSQCHIERKYEINPCILYASLSHQHNFYHRCHDHKTPNDRTDYQDIRDVDTSKLQSVVGHDHVNLGVVDLNSEPSFTEMNQKLEEIFTNIEETYTEDDSIKVDDDDMMNSILIQSLKIQKMLEEFLNLFEKYLKNREIQKAYLLIDHIKSKYAEDTDKEFHTKIIEYFAKYEYVKDAVKYMEESEAEDPIVTRLLHFNVKSIKVYNELLKREIQANRFDTMISIINIMKHLDVAVNSRTLFLFKNEVNSNKNFQEEWRKYLLSNICHHIKALHEHYQEKGENEIDVNLSVQYFLKSKHPIIAMKKAINYEQATKEIEEASLLNEWKEGEIESALFCEAHGPSTHYLVWEKR